MRLVRTITEEEEGAYIENLGSCFVTVRRNPVVTEPIGTILLMPFRVVGYDPDCDRSLMARLERLNLGEDAYIDTLEKPDREYYQLRDCALYPTTAFVVTADEIKQMYESCVAMEGT